MKFITSGLVIIFLLKVRNNHMNIIKCGHIPVLFFILSILCTHSLSMASNSNNQKRTETINEFFCLYV